MNTPDHDESTFTREQFYEKVWSVPATKVAAELGISDVMARQDLQVVQHPQAVPPILGEAGTWQEAQEDAAAQKRRS